MVELRRNPGTTHQIISLSVKKLNLKMRHRFKRRKKEVKPPIKVDPSLSKTTCRVCLENKRTPTTPMEADNLAALFKECSGFDVLLHSGSIYSPTHICNKCKAALKTTKAFLMQSQKTEIILQQIYRCEDLPRAMQVFRKFKAESEEIEATKNKATKKLKEPEINTAQVQDDDLLEIMPQATFIDDDNDLQVLKPIQIVTVKKEQMTELSSFDELKEPKIEIVETGTTIESSDDGWAEEEIPIEPVIKRRGKNKVNQVHEMTICPFCGISLKNMGLHLERCKMNPDIKNESTKPFECALCGKKFTQKPGVEKHLRLVHLNILEVKCQFCDRMFKSSGDRRSHIRRHHMLKRPFECHVCNQGFCSRYDLQVHIRSKHTKETPFACNMCSVKKFSRHSLNLHIQYVHPKHPVYCDVCNKAFNCKKYLQQHSVIHTKEKNYQCPCCEKAFAINHVLKSHVKKMHPEYQMPPQGTIVSVKAVEKLKIKKKRDANLVKMDLKF